MGQRTAVNILELATQRHPVRNSRRLDIVLRRQVGQVMSRGIALHRRVGGNDHLVNLLLSEALLEQLPKKLSVVDVPFARPREIDLQQTPEFNALVSEVRRILGSH